jgi:hypothetical protein
LPKTGVEVADRAAERHGGGGDPSGSRQLEVDDPVPPSGNLFRYLIVLGLQP